MKCLTAPQKSFAGRNYGGEITPLLKIFSGSLNNRAKEGNSVRHFCPGTKEMKINTHKPQSLLSLCVVSLIATLCRGEQLDSTGLCGPTGGGHQPPTNRMPAQLLNERVESLAPAVEKVAPAVVRIVTVVSLDSAADLAGAAPGPLQRYLLGRALGGRAHRPLQVGLGSGVIVTEDGYILTNSHLVAGASEVKVTLQDGREFKAGVIGLDVVTDIAVVRIDACHLPIVALADSRNVRVGDVVLAVGHPFGVGQTVTHGIVSATDRGGIGIEDYESFIQTDAPINPGNSGGPLVDVHGSVIGINTAILSSSGGNLGIGFAVPSSVAQRAMTDLMKYGYVARGYLGLEAQELTPDLAREFDLDGSTGVVVAGVVPKGPADMAGLEVEDVIKRFDGQEVRDTRKLRSLVAEAKTCQTVLVEVVRKGSTKQLRVILGDASTSESLLTTEAFSDQQNPGALQGVTIIELSRQVRQLLRIPGEVQGTVVLDLRAYSAAAVAGLRPGDVIQSVNRQDISSAEDALRLAKNDKDKRTLLRVWSPPGGSHFILIED